jgi:hypothetical protein
MMSFNHNAARSSSVVDAGLDNFVVYVSHITTVRCAVQRYHAPRAILQ